MKPYHFLCLLFICSVLFASKAYAKRKQIDANEPTTDDLFIDFEDKRYLEEYNLRDGNAEGAAGGDVGAGEGGGGGGGDDENCDNKKSSYKFSAYSIKKRIDKIACNRHNKNSELNLTVQVVAVTAEYNEVVLLTMENNSCPQEQPVYRARHRDDIFEDPDPVKPIIFIVHGLDSAGMRDVTFLSHERFEDLLEIYISHLDKFTIYLMPLANPDGYQYELKSEDCWGKNRSPQAQCPGVAVDRNFDVGWNVTHTESSCRSYYPGPAAFSEAESRAIREIFHVFSEKMVAYIHVHASSCSVNHFKGDAILFPKGYTSNVADDDKYVDMKGDLDEAMKNGSFHNVVVNMESLHSWYGLIPGASVDYAAAVYGIPYALEFLMQAYATVPEDKPFGASNITYDELSLHNVWKRVIDSVFHTIHKNSGPEKEKESKRRRYFKR